MTLEEASMKQLAKMLGNLDRWLEMAIEHAKSKPFDPNVLLGARLAPDQFPLYRQVQSACDAAKFAAARLAGKEAPRHEDDEQGFDELRARIREVIDYVSGFTAADFEGAQARVIELPFLEGHTLLGRDYLLEMAQPNFYFHVATAYAILRHNGVPLGKRDYIGALSLRAR